MMVLSIRHRTAYRYHQTVQLGQHRLMLRPRESRDLRLISSAVTISPQASLTWAHDVFGNTIATASFDGWSDSLIIESAVQLELFAPVWPEFGVAATATHYPFAYSDSELTDLGALAAQQYADPEGRLRDWAHGFVASRPTETLALLQDLSMGVSRWISYQSRDDEGTQTPVETLDRGWGSCRDFAVLFVEAARTVRSPLMLLALNSRFGRDHSLLHPREHLRGEPQEMEWTLGLSRSRGLRHRTP